MDVFEVSRLRSEFDTLYHDQPDVGKTMDVGHIKGGVINSEENLVKKLNLAVKAEMEFLAIDGVEYEFETLDSLKKFVEGIKLGKDP